MSTAPRLAAAKHSWGNDFHGCIILHIDMDAFYASCEIVCHPELRGKPVIIGTGHRAVVSAASYEARKFGVNSAMPAATAHRLCPQGIFLPVDMAYYRSMSHQVFEIFHQITDQIEPVSVDECYMDVSGALLQWKDPRKIGAWIRQTVHDQIGVTCSVGIASNKLIAKLASTNAKPNGMLLIPLARQAEFIQMMPVRSIPGVGPSTEKILTNWGITTVKQLSDMSLTDLTAALHSPAQARHLYQASHGWGSPKVVTSAPDKSIGAERTFAEDTRSWKQVTALLRRCCDDVATTLRSRRLYARTVTVKLRLANLSHISKSLTVQEPMNSEAQLYPVAKELLARLMKVEQPQAGDLILPAMIRLAGVSTSHFSSASSASYQPSFDQILENENSIDSEGAIESEKESTKNSPETKETTKTSKTSKITSVKASTIESPTNHARTASQAAKARKNIEPIIDEIRKKYGKHSANLGI